jgi:UDP-3-O-[3-hydroxymyristoyl] glucosamine N-acyltransferase
MKLGELADKIGGEIFGNPETEIIGVSGVADAKDGQITFVSSPKFIDDLRKSGASCVIVREPIEGIGIPQLLVSNPYFAFAKALEIFHPRPPFKEGISKSAFVSGGAEVGKGVSISPFACISDAVSIGEGTTIGAGAFIGTQSKIGSWCIIYPNVTIREGVSIGNRVTVHSGAVIGSDGFGYVLEQGVHYKIPQVGGVVIEDDVEIGSNVSIDRATLGNTIVGKGTKIDNLVQIAHNVKIGENSLVIAQVGISGSSEIGDYVVLAGQAGVADHSKIESGTMIGAQAGLTGHYTKGGYSGSPAIPHKLWLRAQSLFARLPEMHKRLRELEERLNSLEKEKENRDAEHH